MEFFARLFEVHQVRRARDRDVTLFGRVGEAGHETGHVLVGAQAVPFTANHHHWPPDFGRLVFHAAGPRRHDIRQRTIRRLDGRRRAGSAGRVGSKIGFRPGLEVTIKRIGG